MSRSPARFLLLVLVVTLAIGPPEETAAGGDEVLEPDRSPIGLALSPDGRWALTANATADSASLIDLDEGRVAVEVPVGRRPFGVAMSRDGARAVVTNHGSDSLTVLEVRPPWVKVAGTVALGAEPRGVALSADGARAFVALSGDDRLALVELGSLSVVSSASVGTEPWHVALTPDGQRVAVGNARSMDVHVLDAGDLSLLHRVRLLGRNVRQLAVSPDGAWAYVPTVTARDVPTTRGPVGVAFRPGGATVVVANALANALQLVDVERATVVRTISLGGPREPSLARQGEALFHDATRSFHQWYSCHSCHTDGHTNGGSYDTFNDGRAGNPKKTLSLRGVTRTAPYTWHGWQSDLRAALAGSFTKTLQGPAPTAAELDALVAFLATNDFAPPRPGESAAAVTRGAELFARQGCDTCHRPPLYTSAEVFKVGFEAPDDVHEGFNPPSLRNVRSRAPYLHDGRARSLDEVLREHDPRGPEDLTPAEVADLIAFLETL